MTDNRDQADESWGIARNYALLLGELPSTFTSTIRSLLIDEERNQGQLNNGSRSQVFRVLRGDAPRTLLHYAAKSFRPDKVTSSSTELLNERELLQVFKLSELAALLGMMYFFRRARQLVGPEEWSGFGEQIQREADIGFLIGDAIEKIGGAHGLLTLGIRGVAYCPLHLHDKKGFADYRRYLKKHGAVADSEYEMKRWGCTSAQISSALVQTMGFGIPFANAVGNALLSPNEALERLPDDVYRLKLVEVWADALLKMGVEPAITHKGQFYPVKEKRERLISEANHIRMNGSRFGWLARAKEGASPGVDTEPETSSDSADEPGV